MQAKALPFDKSFIDELRKKYPTPFHIYDEAAIRRNARKLIDSFSWCSKFKEYFAVKALPNPRILSILKEEGCGGDCSSLPELMLCERVGIRGEDIMFTSNNTPQKEYKKAIELGAVVNLDDITHIDYLAKHFGMPELICVRYNPGPLRKGNAIIGEPEKAKFGFTRDQVLRGYEAAKRHGAKRFGLHTMIASNEREAEYFVETARMVFELATAVHKELGIRIEFVNLGGGMGIPYRPNDPPLDLSVVSKGVQNAYQQMIASTPLDPLAIYLENGRYITGPAGYLVTEVIHKKETYKDYVGVDACMANLMRPGMYGAYHHISVLGKENEKPEKNVDVVGSLCENNDKFAIDRPLPHMEIGDVLVIHDTGAHGHAMGFQYNGKLRSAELLLTAKGDVELIRRAETIDDLFATLNLA